MILPVMAYAVGVGFVLAAMGAMLERVLAHRRRPRRLIWAAVLATTLLLTVAVPWRRPGPSPGASTSTWIASTTDRVLGTGAGGGGSSAEPRWFGGLRSEADEVRDVALRLDSVAGLGWALGSVSVAGMYAAALLTLSRRRRTWRETYFRGMRILVASTDGPAVVGVWKPRIVVPEWTLVLQPPAVDLMLEHEREHQRARDPLLLHVAGLGVMVMPWNPAAWWMLSRLKLAVEMDCDARVLRRDTAATPIGGRDAVAYSELLLTVATHRSPTHSFVAPAMLEHPSTLRRRFAAMYPNHRGFTGVRIATACGAALALLTIALLVPAQSVRAQSTNIAVASPGLRAQAGQATTPAAPPAGSTQVYEIGNGVSAPVPIRQQDPTYTHAAMQAKVQGEAQLSGIVETNGLLDQIHVTKSLDTVYGLDQAAIDAAKKWVFKPAMKDGKAVPVHVQLTMEFRLH